MSSLGIDYSSTRAYLGVVDKDRVKATASLVMGEDVRGFLKSYQILLAGLTTEHNIDLVVIEQAWSREGRYAWIGLQTEHMKTLLQAGSLLLGDFEVKLVLPNVWRKTVFGHGKPEDSKQYAVDWVKENLGYDVPVMGKTGRGNKPDHNYAEAVCLAVYGERKR